MARITDNYFSPHRDCPQCDCLMFRGDVDREQEQAEYICTGCGHRLTVRLEENVVTPGTQAQIRVWMKVVEANLDAYEAMEELGDREQAMSFLRDAQAAGRALQDALDRNRRELGLGE